MVTISSPGTATLISQLSAGEFALLPKSVFRGAALVMGLDNSRGDQIENPKALVFGAHPQTGKKAPFIVSSVESAWGGTLVLKLVNPTLVLLTEQAELVPRGSWDEDHPGSIFSFEDESFVYARQPDGWMDSIRIGLDGKIQSEDLYKSVSYRTWQLVRRVAEIEAFEVLFSWPSQQTPFLKE